MTSEAMHSMTYCMLTPTARLPAVGLAARCSCSRAEIRHNSSSVKLSQKTKERGSAFSFDVISCLWRPIERRRLCSILF